MGILHFLGALWILILATYIALFSDEYRRKYVMTRIVHIVWISVIIILLLLLIIIGNIYYTEGWLKGVSSSAEKFFQIFGDEK